MKKLLFITALLCTSLNLMADDTELPTITIRYSNDIAKVNIPSSITDVEQTIDGADVVLTSNTLDTEYCYKVIGSSANGSLTINGNYKLTLELAGVNLTSQNGAAISVECGKRIAVILDEDTDNTLADCEDGAQKAALYFSGHPEFEGAGTLTVFGNTKHGISAKEYLELKKSTGLINIKKAVSDGIHCGKGKKNNENNHFTMKGGQVNIFEVGGDAIDSDDYGVVNILGGNLYYSVTADGGKGIKCYDTFTMSGGEIRASLEGGTLYELNDTSRCMAINVGGDLNLSGGNIAILRQNEQSKAYKVKGNLNVTGEGQIEISGGRYSYQPNDYKYDMTLYAVAEIEGEPVSDYSNYQIGAFSGSECQGTSTIYTVAGNTTYTMLRLHSNTESGENISFRIYDASEGSEFPSTNNITFAADATEGEPGSPVVIKFTTDTSSVSNIKGNMTPANYYTVSGIRTTSAQKGINIAVDSDGNATKIVR